MPPLAVIKILIGSPNVPLSVIRSFVSRRLHRGSRKIFFLEFNLIFIRKVSTPLYPFDLVVCSQPPFFLSSDNQALSEDARQCKIYNEEKEKMKQELLELRSGYIYNLCCCCYCGCCCVCVECGKGLC